MAFEADCGVSTVLEENRVASTARFPRDEALRDSGALTRGSGSRLKAEGGWRGIEN